MAIYVSFDIEATGPIPGLYSMISLGACAFDEKSEPGQYLSTFYVNIDELEGSQRHTDTMLFWEKNKVAWEQTQVNQLYPEHAMKDFLKWTKSLGERRLTAVAYPAGFDFTFLYWYLIRFCEYSPFSFSCLDIKTYISAMMKLQYRSVGKKSTPKEWHSKDHQHTHNALDDACEQADLFMNILAHNR